MLGRFDADAAPASSILEGRDQRALAESWVESHESDHSGGYSMLLVQSERVRGHPVESLQSFDSIHPHEKMA